jgi:hypothetical protein
MKNFLALIGTAVFVYLIMAFTNRVLFVEQIPVDTRPAIEIMMPKLEAPKIEIDLKDHNSFLNKIGHVESGNRYSVVNRWGYMGKYQFGKETLQALDINTSKKEFLSRPILQEQAMDKLLNENKKALRRYIKKYDGKIVHGVLVTESGILAAAHLGGAGNVANWFKDGEDFKDGNGTPITRYMKIFQGYSLDLQ